MKKVLLAGVAALAIAGSTAVYAQQRPWFHQHHRMNSEDRAAFADARIAAVHAGLKLTPDQDRLWPPLESAVRDFAKLRIDRANARMDARQERTDYDRGGRRDESREADTDRGRRDFDPVARLRERAETMGSTAAALKRIADAADPLYKTLDDGQKRRLAILTHMEGRFGRGEDRGRREFWRNRDDGSDFNGERGRDRGGDRDRGYERDRGPGHEGGGGVPERL
jgi:LTXXQ motif family protein